MADTIWGGINPSQYLNPEGGFIDNNAYKQWVASGGFQTSANTQAINPQYQYYQQPSAPAPSVIPPAPAPAAAPAAAAPVRITSSGVAPGSLMQSGTLNPQWAGAYNPTSLMQSGVYTPPPVQETNAGGARRSPLMTLSDAPAPNWYSDPSTGWVAPSGTINNTQAFPNLNSGMSTMEQDYGYAPNYTRGMSGSMPNDAALQTAGGSPAGPVNPYDQLGLDGLPQMGQVDFGQMPQMSGQFDPGFTSDYFNRLAQQSGQTGSYWDQGNFPTAQTAQQNLSQVPQVEAQTPQSFEALQFLLSGQGFDPATMAKMHANSSDAIANQGSANMSAGRLAAERAGLGNSGLNVALAEQNARDTGAAQTASRNQIDIANAQQGAQNRVAGAGLESSRQTNAAQMANLVALQNASSLIQAMNQNVANLQQSNMANFQGQQQTATNKAAAQTASNQTGSNAYNTGALNQAAQANSQNAANQMNWQLNNRQMNNENNRLNVGNANSNAQNAQGNLVALINGTNPAGYNQQGTTNAGTQVADNSLLGAVLGNYATGATR